MHKRLTTPIRTVKRGLTGSASQALKHGLKQQSCGLSGFLAVNRGSL
jgi:hypothetical protein